MKINSRLLPILLLTTVSSLLGASPSAECVPTKADQLGPYYVSDMPLVTNIKLRRTNGTDIVVRGIVRNSKGEPLANVRLEVWQADGRGIYYPMSNGSRSKFSPSQLNLRGTILSDDSGKYEFLTVAPDPERGVGRPPHFHYRISAIGYKTLVTQHYVQLADEGPIADACRSRPLTETENGTVYQAPDIFLSAL